MSRSRPFPRASALRFLVECFGLAILAFPIALAAAPIASAQQAGGEPTAQEREAAADAFDRGTRAYLSRDYTRAAQWFETAYRMAPAAAAMVQAVRAYERAGNHVRAATLALRLQALHPDERDAARQSEQTLRRAGELVRIDVACDAECAVELDGTLMEHPSFFVAPATDHVVRATFATGPVEQRVAASEAGATRELRFEAPPPPPEPVAVAEPTAEPEAPIEPASAAPVTPQQGGGGGLSPAVAITGVALTAAAGGVLIWSGVDTLDGVDEYEANPTPEALADGQDRELRTNVLIGVTAGLAAVSLVLLIFTDWDGERASEQPPLQAVLVPTEGGAYGMVGGSF